ncbi:MAG TPA: hypothetical protein VJ654_20210 [Noviherbaspirillum sp.]|nr:hypothetical protein [Noviherbaspirillum sp.]
MPAQLGFSPFSSFPKHFSAVNFFQALKVFREYPKPDLTGQASARPEKDYANTSLNFFQSRPIKKTSRVCTREFQAQTRMKSNKPVTIGPLQEKQNGFNYQHQPGVPECAAQPEQVVEFAEFGIAALVLRFAHQQR